MVTGWMCQGFCIIMLFEEEAMLDICFMDKEYGVHLNCGS